MDDLGELTIQPKTGDESFKDGNTPLDLTLLDFWRWGVSDVVSNATRGLLAEFIVGSALGLDMENSVRKEWAPYDLILPGVATIEVKSCAYIQSWYQRKYSPISFSIRPSRQWDSATNIWSEDLKRQADLYVFCLLRFKGEKTKVNPLDMEQWEFYVVPTKVLDINFPNLKSISLAALKKITPAVEYSALKNCVLDCAPAG